MVRQKKDAKAYSSGIPLPYIIVTITHISTSPYRVAMSNSGPVYASSRRFCVQAVQRPQHREKAAISSRPKSVAMGAMVLTSMVIMSGPPMSLYHIWSKSRWLPWNSTSRTKGEEIPRVSSGIAALTTMSNTAVLRNCAMNTFSAMLLCRLMKLTWRSKALMLLMTTLSSALMIVTAVMVATMRTVSPKAGFSKKPSHCSLSVDSCRSLKESTERSPPA
mmetsp:Transcript_9322/g.22934  ORF Transcript_9322/g.22934 Transcript_9322/m.22934 type:complete len:219 (+) Transcript_9322:773-1429(+)